VSLLLPVSAALAGACVYGVTGVLQQRATHRVQGHDQLGFIRGLIAQPLWLLSTIGSIAGFALQGVALGSGPIVLVQPLLVTGVLFAALTGFLISHRPVDWPLMGSLLLTAGGLAAFLLCARPTQGSDTLTLNEVLPLAIALFGLLLGCLALALRTRGLSRSLSFALASGIVYGVTAAVAKVTIGAFESGGLHAGLTDWSLWALVVLGPLGFLLNQNAFREGDWVSPPLAVITVTDPLVGIGIGVLWLGESIDGSPPAVAGEVLGLAAMAVGVWLVAHRAPHLSQTFEAETAAASDEPPLAARERDPATDRR
jgi:drug/metabolite transporter (DMT)-like permease